MPTQQQTANAITAVQTYTAICRMMANHINKNPHLASHSLPVRRVEELQINQYLSKKTSISLRIFINGLTSSSINITKAELKPSTASYMATIIVEWISPAQSANPPSSASGRGAQLPAAQSPKGFVPGNYTTASAPAKKSTVESLIKFMASVISKYKSKKNFMFNISSREFYLLKEHTKKGVLTDDLNKELNRKDIKVYRKDIKVLGYTLDCNKETIIVRWDTLGGAEFVKPEESNLPIKEIYEQNKKRTNCIKCGTTTTPKMLLSSTVRYCGGCCG